MSSYGIVTVEFEKPPNRDEAIKVWPTRRLDYIRWYAVTDEYLVVLLNKSYELESVLASILDTTPVQRVAYVACNDTTDSAAGTLYAKIGGSMQELAHFADGEDLQFGKKMRRQFLDECGIQPWAIWDIWDYCYADRPLVVDIDRTLTWATGGFYPDALWFPSNWEDHLVLTTELPLAFGVIAAHYIGAPTTVIAENGGVVAIAEAEKMPTRNLFESFEDLVVLGDPAATRDLRNAYTDRDFDLGFGPFDLLNEWAMTSVVARGDIDRETFESIATENGFRVVGTGDLALSAVSENVNKGVALDYVAERLGFDYDDAIAVGDSVTDIPVFDRVGESYALDQSDDETKGAADTVVDERFGRGFVEAIERSRSDNWRRND